MCASGPGPLRSRGAGRCAALRGRGPPWRCRCPRCWSCLCRRCWNARSARPDGAGAVRGAAAAAGAVEAAPHPYPLGVAGAEPPGRAGDSLLGGKTCCPVGMWVALSSPSSLPLFPRRCLPLGVDLRLGFGFLGFFRRAPFSTGAGRVPLRPPKGCPRAGVAREPSWRGQGCLQAAQRGGGLRRGLSPSHAARLPHPAVPPLRWEWLVPLLPVRRAQAEIGFCLP